MEDSRLSIVMAAPPPPRLGCLALQPRHREAAHRLAAAHAHRLSAGPRGLLGRATRSDIDLRGAVAPAALPQPEPLALPAALRRPMATATARLGSVRTSSVPTMPTLGEVRPQPPAPLRAQRKCRLLG